MSADLASQHSAIQGQGCPSLACLISNIVTNMCSMGLGFQVLMSMLKSMHDADGGSLPERLGARRGRLPV
jgi:hypothetical protein